VATERSQKAKALADKAKEFVMLARTKYFDPKKDQVRGWVMSEKLDGVRARWHEGKLVSRNGNVFRGVPPEILMDLQNELGDVPYDGEIWAGRQMKLQTLVGLVKNGKTTVQDWRDLNLHYHVFDCVRPGTWSARVEGTPEHLSYTEWAHWHSHVHIQDSRDLNEEVEQIWARGGEGLILRNPEAHYKLGRSNDLLKVKCYEDREAIVTGHIPGEGKHTGRLGALLCEFLPNEDVNDMAATQTPFKVGTGLTDAERANPPSITSMVTVRFMGLTEDGLPREPRFVAFRDYE